MSFLFPVVTAINYGVERKAGTPLNSNINAMEYCLLQKSKHYKDVL